MRIENLAHLLQGQLLNTPSIRSIEGWSATIDEVRRGDLFFASTPALIPQAIQKGAYAIVFAGEGAMEDPEIAWIRVDSISKAAQRLLRFLIVSHSTTPILLDPITFDLAQEYLDDPKIAWSTGDPLADLAYFRSNPPQLLAFWTGSYFQELQLDPALIPSPSYQILQRYPLETSLLVEGHYHERLPIAPLFEEELVKLWGLIHHHQLRYSWSAPPKSHFSPIFFTPRGRIVPFGKSSKVLIVEPDLSLAQRARTYLEQAVPWAKRGYWSVQKLAGFQEVPIEGVVEMLYNSPFHYTLYVGATLETIQPSLPQREPTLL
ncbi:MAG: hypothetical protein C6I00_02395 [Nitratiruptor sp.]|nr:hypothetical protein [Nitratiruptor sp.]NPA84136.1 hypothetical protein [Campylobacterota bacterium]